MTRLVLILVMLLAVAMPLSLLAGRVWIDPVTPFGSGPNAALIMLDLRLPRAVLAMLIGAGLGVSGAAMQGYLRNPLADPALFGIAPGAALGAVTALWLGLSAWLPWAALAGGAGAMALLALIAGERGSIAVFTLAGMMIASLAGALTSLIISLAPNAYAQGQIVTWLMGALTDRSWDQVRIAAPLCLGGGALLLFTGRGLDALTLGEVAARSLGADPRRLRWLMVAGTGLAVGGGVAVAGVIGFVGLVVPHLLRRFTDGRPSQLLVPAALAGALLLLLADVACRVLPLVTELRLGIALSLLGAPFFLSLLVRMRRDLA